MLKTGASHPIRVLVLCFCSGTASVSEPDAGAALSPSAISDLNRARAHA